MGTATWRSSNRGAGLGPDKYPSMSVSIAEEEVRAIGPEYLKGHYAAWNYFKQWIRLQIRSLLRLFRKIR